MTIQNASQMPRIFYCKHMQPGIAKYENETILVDVEGMRNLIASVGKKTIPVYIGHQNVDLKEIKEQSSGYVADSFYNELDGWAWFKMIIIDDEGHEAIKKGWAVSNAYIPTDWGNGGTKNNCPYNREVRNGEFTHLAIVPDPRYEGACIMTPDEFKNYQEVNRKKLDELKNSKEKPMLKLFKTKREEVTGSAVDLDTSIELENGKSLTIREMVEAVVENSKKQEQKVMVGDVEMTIEELVNAHAKLNAKNKMKNGETKMEKDPNEEDVDGDQDDEGDDEIGKDKKNKKMKKNKKEKKNADGDMEDCYANDDGDDDEKKEKKNSKESEGDGKEVEVDDKFFHEMRNAHLKPGFRVSAPMVTTLADGIALGKKRYGSGK